MQDQFFWSNILCIYLLIYALEDLWQSPQIDRKFPLKFAIAIFALMGFYPSQLPFFLLAGGIGLWLHPNLNRKNLQKHLLNILGISAIAFGLFISQFLNTDEVVKHFDISDAVHGQNIGYIPFWSILDVVPKTGGTPKDLGGIILIVVSSTIGFLVTRYCIKLIPSLKPYFNLAFILYGVYSLSYLILPGAYRQSKFFFIYILPLIVFCWIKVLLNRDLKRRKTIKTLLAILAVYVSINSFTKPYKPHVNQEISTAIEKIKLLNQPITFYTNTGSIAHGYYYFAYQLRSLDFQLMPHCPSPEELNASDNGLNTIVIAKSCPAIPTQSPLQARIFYTNINGLDNEGY